ncbi:MAG: YdcH family protein [Lysobacteraceae bacterium]
MFESQPQSDVEAMLSSDTEFRRLYWRHKELDKQVLDAELGVLPIDDTTLVRMKKEKLHAKDRLTRMFESRQRRTH